MARANSVKYGDIALVSETETMEEMIKHLKTIVTDLGYPSKDINEADALKKFEEGLKKQKEDDPGIPEGEEDLVPEAEE